MAKTIFMAKTMNELAHKSPLIVKIRQDDILELSRKDYLDTPLRLLVPQSV